MATINLTLSDKTPTQITGLTANADYYIQGFYTITGTQQRIESAFEVFKGEPSEGTDGIRGYEIKITANDDIYVKALNVPTKLVILEC